MRLQVVVVVRSSSSLVEDSLTSPELLQPTVVADRPTAAAVHLEVGLVATLSCKDSRSALPGAHTQMAAVEAAVELIPAVAAPGRMANARWFKRWAD